MEWRDRLDALRQHEAEILGRRMTAAVIDEVLSLHNEVLRPRINPCPCLGRSQGKVLAAYLKIKEL